MITITTEFLKSNNYNNPKLFIRLSLAEDQKKINDKKINYYYEQKKILESKYNTRHELNKLNETYTEKIDIIKKKYDTNYINLQKKFNKLDLDRRRKIIISNTYKVEIDILNNTIFTKKHYKTTLQIEIVKLEKQISHKQLLCNKTLGTIDLDYKNILVRYINDMSPCIVGGAIKNYSLISDKHVEKEIKKLEIINNSFKKYNYIINEDEYVKNHKKVIKETTENIKNKLININKYYTLELDNMRNLIIYYNKLKKLDNIENIMKLIETLEVNKLKLENDINKLEKKFTLLSTTLNSYNIICQKKINKLNCHKYKLL